MITIYRRSRNKPYGSYARRQNLRCHAYVPPIFRISKILSFITKFSLFHSPAWGSTAIAFPCKARWTAIGLWLKKAIRSLGWRNRNFGLKMSFGKFSSKNSWIRRLHDFCPPSPGPGLRLCKAPIRFYIWFNKQHRIANGWTITLLPQDNRKQNGQHTLAKRAINIICNFYRVDILRSGHQLWINNDTTDAMRSKELKSTPEQE